MVPYAENLYEIFIWKWQAHIGIETVLYKILDHFLFILSLNYPKS